MSKPQPDESLIQDYLAMLETDPPSGRKKEQVVQDFLETHTELIPTPVLLNHGLHLDSVLSKFPLDTSLVTDLAYITKSSDRWFVVLVELERPEKEIFKSATKRVATTQKFNEALDQIGDWQTFIEANGAEVVRRLMPLLAPTSMIRNLVHFKYVLIIGRSANKNLTRARQAYLARLREQKNIDVMSYDSLVNNYRYLGGDPKNVLRLTGEQYGFKYLNDPPFALFSYLGPDVLTLSKEQGEALAALDYDIDRWREGELLVVNGKHTERTAFERAEAKKSPH